MSLGARNAHYPFGIGELAGEIAGLLELDVGGGRPLGHHGRLGGGGDIVADRADREGVVARLQAIFREAEAALRVGGHAGLDDRARLLGAHDHALHGALLVGGDLPGEGSRGRALCPGRRR